MGSVPVGRKKRADATGGPQTFRSPTAVVIWWVWLLFAAANLIDLAVQGRDHLSLVAAAILVLATGVAYVTAQRPRIVADSAGVTVVNPLRDHHVGWAGVTKVDLADLLRVHCRGEPGQDRRRSSTPGRCTTPGAASSPRKPRCAGRPRGPVPAARPWAASAWAAGYVSGRRETRLRQRPGRRGLVVGRGGRRADRPGAQRVRDRRPGRGGLGRTAPWRSPAPGPRPGSDRPGTLPQIPALAGWLEPLTSTWDRTALLALLIPALILLVVALV